MADLEFFAEPSPTREQCDSLAELYPTNPFATYEYFRAETVLGSNPLLVGCRSHGETVFGCFATIRKGRLNSRLIITSLPCTEEPFLRGLKAACSRLGITTLELNTFSSAVSSIPPIGEELTRAKRTEFVMGLQDRSIDLLKRMNKGHRLTVQKAIRSGLGLRTVHAFDHLTEHMALIESSMLRRQGRGEQVTNPSERILSAYINSGLCTLYQAVLSGEALSSITIASARAGVYLHTSGTSPKGMGLGASHFLLYEILKDCQQRGISVFNFGGVRDFNSGLADYKRHFGADAIALEAAEFYVGGALRKHVSNWIDRARDRARQ